MFLMQFNFIGLKIELGDETPSNDTEILNGCREMNEENIARLWHCRHTQKKITKATRRSREKNSE